MVASTSLKMKHLLTFLAFAAVVLVLSLGLHGADGTLVNSSGTTTVGGASSPGNYLTNNQSTQVTFTNAAAASGRVFFVTNGMLFLGTNYTGANTVGGMYGTNVFSIDTPGFIGALNVNTNGSIYCSGPGFSLVGALQFDTLASSQYAIGKSGSTVYIKGADSYSFAVALEGARIDSALKLGFSSGAPYNTSLDVYFSRNAAGTVLVNTNLVTRGTITATNGYEFPLATLVTLTNIVYTNVTLDFGSTATLSFSDLLVNAQNLKSNDIPVIAPPAISMTNGVFTAWVSNTVLYARYNNYAATAINPASGIFNIQVFQYK